MNNNQKLINNFLSYLVSRGVSKKSLKFYKSDISNFLDWANDQEISNNLVRQYIQSQKLITPPSTINRRLSTLRSFASFNSRGFMDGIENVSYPKVSSGSKYQVSRFSPYKKVQEWLLNKTRSERLKNYLSKLFFSRPDWYKRYHSYPLSTYIHIAILILFTSISGYGVYDQVFRGSSDSLAFPTALTRPNRYLSFQGRLTDNLGNPETTATNMVFKLYDASSGGTELWNSNTCSVTPDQDGIFSLLLGTTSGSGFTCGSATEIASSVFSENAEVWLGVTVGADSEATPRIQIATVAYALNSETLQGYPAGTGTSTIPYINSSGEVVLANASPTIESTSGTFAVKGQAMTISTADTTNGNITINPDGTGTLNLTFEGTSAGGSANGFVNATNANITSGSLYAGTVASDATGYNFINFISGTTPTSKFSVSATGLTTIGADLYVSSGISTFGTAVSDGTVEATKFCTGDGETNCVTDFSTLGGGSSKWNAITNPDGNTSLSHSTYTTTFNWATGTGTDNLFSLTSDASANGTGALLNLQTGASSSLMPLRVRAGSAEAIAVDSSGKVGIGDTSPVSLFTVGSGDLFQVNSSGIIASIDGVAHIIDDVSGNLTLKSNSTAVSIDDDLYVSSGISTFGTAVTDGTVEATKFCTGDGETNCVTDFAPIVSGSLLWTSSGSLLYPTTLTKLVGVGTNSPISRLSVINNPGAGNYTGKAAFLVDQYESQDILTASASGVTKMTLQSDGTLKLVNASSTISNDSGDISIVPAGGNLSITGNTITSGVIQAGNTSAVSYSRLGSGTTGHSGNLSAASDLLLQDLEVDGTLFLDGGTIANSAGTASIILSSTPTITPAYLTAQNWFVENTANVGQAALIVNQTKSGDLFTASASGTTKFTIQNDGDVVLTNGQLRLGNLSSAPTAEGAGSMFFNTTTNTNQCYNGTNWYNCGGTLYSNTNASVADGSYITVNHALATNDLLSSAWINDQGVWKSLDANYKPAIAWEGKDTQKGVYHNNINSYISGNETGAGTSTLHDGLIFDTFEDTSKTDSANTSASLTVQMGDNGSSNYTTLNQRVQTGRIGLMGGQTYNSSTTDNDGQTYLGSNTVNDIYYYDRGKDSIPEVLVELGIDPNWYNGVTLSVATSSASYSQSGTLADKNPNLTPNYNGSLVKATGTDTEPRTIYITIKSPTTFDWTNYQGDSATGVTITAGTAQTLGSTGVSVTFTGGVNYNTGDVFKIASWYIEGESATRGAKQQFPERSNIIATASSVDIIDADTQKLWMNFGTGSNYILGSNALNSSKMLNGILYVAGNAVRIADFIHDRGYTYQTSGQHIKGSISERNSDIAIGVGNSSLNTIVNTINDVDVAVIPNQPTQEVTVSGWGYIQGDGASTTLSESVDLPFNFSSAPKIVITNAGHKTNEPTTLNSCNSNAASLKYHAADQEHFKFKAVIYNTSGTAISANYYCYAWTATGTISPKQLVAVATDSGLTVIDESNGKATDYSNVSGDDYNQVSLTSNGRLYGTNETQSQLEKWKNIASNTTDKVPGTPDYIWKQTTIPAITATAPTIQTNSSALNVTEYTSTSNPKNDTIYLGTNLGVAVIQDNENWPTADDGSDEASGSVKYYTKDYISEEMIGDIRGMWPLNGNNTASDFEDISIKANTLTGTNITSADAVSGVRGEAYDFDGSTEYLSCTDASCGGTSKLDFDASSSFSITGWFRTNGTFSSNRYIVSKKSAATNGIGYGVYVDSNGKLVFGIDDDTTSFPGDSVTSGIRVDDSQWHHLAAVNVGTSAIYLYLDGQLVGQDTSISENGTLDNSGNFTIGGAATTGNWLGYIDEISVTATSLNSQQIKNMYQVGYRALQSHGTGLGGGSADANQSLGYISTGTNSVGVVQPDLNNQYMYVGTNSTTLGSLSKIQLNSDTNIKTYNSSANVPAGGALLIDEDVTSLAVGETLYAVGSAASGVKSMGVDDNATATSGNFVSKTYALPKNIGSAVLWVSPVIDGSDGSNTLTVKASNDGGSNYVTCTLVGTDSNRNIPEKEYACTFSTADNDLKVKFEFARGSTKTNTYVTEYGITWLGETGFRVEQADNNNVRLYNFSGETQNLKLNVTGASVAALANPWTDAGSYLYATGYETLRLYDGTGTNYLGLSHDGTLANLTYNGTTVLSINSNGDLLPNTDDTQSLGSNTKRWKDLFLGGETLHIGTSLTDEGTISYDTTNNILNFGTDSTSNGDIAFFTDQLYLNKSTGNVGIGTTAPNALLDVSGTATISGTLTVGNGTINQIRAPYGPLSLQYKSGSDTWSTGLTLQDTTGNVGIGTLADSTIKLIAKNSDASNSYAFRIYDYNDPNFTVSDGGGVSITPTSIQAGITCTASSNCSSSTLDGGTFTDNTSESNSLFGGNQFDVLATGTSANTSFYLGLNHPFKTIRISLSTAGISGGTPAINAYYWNGSAWTAVSNLVDSTSSLTAINTGTISFDLPTNWVAKSVNGSSDLYYIRLRNTGSTYTTAPKAYNISVKNGNQIFTVAETGGSGMFIIKDDGNIQFHAGYAGGSITADIAGSTTTNGVCHSGSASATNNVDIVDCSGTPSDIAEFYPGTSDLEPGDVVSLIPDSVYGSRVKKSDYQYSPNSLGVVSTIPTGPNGSPMGEGIFPDNEYPQAIGLSGRVPVKVSLENGPIEVNDLLTTSSIPGIAMKATKPGRVLGRAIERYDGSVKVSSGTRSQEQERQKLGIEFNKNPQDPTEGIGKILMFIEPASYDPDFYLNEAGNLVINSANIANNNDFHVATINGIVNRIGNFAKLVTANINVGLASIQKIISPRIETSLISPIANSELIIDLQPDNSQSASKLVIKGENDQEVASVDAEGNASFSGQLTSNELQVANDATISGTLYADNIESKRLQDIEDLLREVETNQQILTEASSWNLNTATNSADLATYFDLHTTNLYVTGQTALSSLFISDNFTTKNINSLEGPLEIQSLAASPLEIMAGKILIDTDGNTKFLGNVEVAGNLTINNLVVANNIDPIATESAQVVEGEINSNSTAGKATLSANTEKIRINNNKVSLNTLIYITPITSTQNKVLFVKEKGQGYFDIGFSDLLDSDVEFNWWIIELQSSDVQ